MAQSDQVSSENLDDNQDIAFDETIAIPLSEMPNVGEQQVPQLGIVWHPDFSRIGDVFCLSTGKKEALLLSRTSPAFLNVSSGTCSPLMDRRVSRSPVSISYLGDDKFLIAPPESKMVVMVNGQQVTEPTVASLSSLGADIIVTLSNSVVLSLCMGPAKQAAAGQKTGLLGVSAQIQKAWQTIEQAGPTDLPVLIKGETGTGKELVAQALHAASLRAAEPLISVNMATLSPELGAADLFGASKGAFTGAVRDRLGLFEQATNSSIFLDEIGDAPATVQAMLLRTLETGEFRRVGETRIRKTAARIIAATDRPLEPENFSQPLLRRLENISVTMAPLRDRRVDIGVMIVHFLQQHNKLGLVGNLTPWIASLVLHSWPGNVRELRNVVQQMTLNQVPEVLQTPMDVASSPENGALDIIEPAKPRPAYRKSQDVTENEMLAALEAADWNVRDAAVALNISRTVLYSLMAACPKVRKIEDITPEEIAEIMEASPDDLIGWAKNLKVSKEALRRKILQLGLG